MSQVYCVPFFTLLENVAQPYRFVVNTPKSVTRFRIVSGLYWGGSNAIPQRVVMAINNHTVVLSSGNVIIPNTNFMDIGMTITPGSQMMFYLQDARTAYTQTTFGANDNLNLIFEFQ